MTSAPYPTLIDLFLRSPRRAPAQRQALVDTALRNLVRHAWDHIPVYRRLWNDHGVTPADVQCAGELARLPWVEKNQLIDAGLEARDARIPGEELDEMRTSGTSGRSIHIVRNRFEVRVTRRAILRHFVRIGMRPWHRTITMASGWLKNRKGRIMRHISKTRHIEPQTPLDEQIQTLEEFRPAAIVGQTGGIYLLARELLRRGRTFPLGFVVPTGATLMPEMRQAMRTAFSVDPRDMYGAIETGPITWQCRNGVYHIDADRVIVEIVDEQGRPMPVGQPGQVVCTYLFAWSMPFIRYRLFDISALSSATCDCGCRFPLMEPVQGRVNDFLPTPRGDVVSPHFFFHLFDDARMNPVKEWRIIQESESRLLYEYIPEEQHDPAALERGVGRIRERFGAACIVESRAVAALPMTSVGKRRCIISKLRNPNTTFDEVWVGGGPPNPGSDAPVLTQR